MYPTPSINNRTLKALPYTLYIVLLITTGCQKDNPDSFTAAVEALTQPNQYQTRLKWNINDDDADGWMIQRKTEKDVLTTLTSTGKDAHEYIDSSVVAGNTYHYVLSASNSDSSSGNRTLDITVPRDLAVSGVTALPTVSGIGRLIIPKGSKIVTNGKDIDISVDQIISDGGVIETFPEGQTALINTPGRPGGKVAIHARTGTGTLYVVARGENGGPSTAAGSQGGPGVPGLPGPNGNCGYKGNDAACGIEQSAFDQVVQKCKDGGIMGDLYCQILRNFYCKMQPGNGNQGSQGFPGGQGGVGFNGGDSGNILVDIADANNIQIVPTSVAGVGGAGGPGGPGGVGGPGGAPGNPDRLRICSGSANSGPQGPTGPVGQPGPAGAPGVTGAICLKLNAGSTGDCSKF